MTGRINIVNTSILPTAIYIFSAVSFKIPTKQKEKNSTTCIKLLLLFSCQVMSDSLWLHSLQHTRLPSSLHVLEFAQVRAHWIGDAIQSSHPLSSPFLTTFNLSQYQGVLQWVSSSHTVVYNNFDSKCDFAPPTILLRLLLCSWTWVSFLVGSNILLSMVVQQPVVILEFS